MLNTGKLAGKTIFITGASRGIGKAIALKAARDGANIVVAAKTAEPHPKLPGTIYTAAKEIESAGGQALPSIVDVRDEESVQNSIEQAVKQFGGIDIVINNASAIHLTGTEATPMKRFDLMHQINTRGTFLVSKLAAPYLRASKKNPHILNISPPLSMKPMWFKDNVAYTMAKYGMSMCVLGMSEEFKDAGIAVNALWPQTAIITAAMEMLGGKDVAKMCRKPEIMSDAAYVILTRDKSFTGNFVIDEAILKEEGCKDFDQYAVEPGHELLPDGFIDSVDENVFSMVPGSSKAAGGKAASSAGSGGGGGGGAGGVSNVFKDVEGILNEDLVKKVNAVYAFDVQGSDTGTWFIDLKNGSGSVGSGDPSSGPADVTFTLKDSDFLAMFQGKLKPTNAFMTGKLKLKGDMGKAMALEKMMKKMPARGFHTSAYRGGDVSKVFDDVKGVLDESLVKKVNAVYAFKVEGSESGTWFIDLKNGAGSVGSGEPTSGAADVTFTLKDADFISMFQGKLKPTNAFMTGKLKLSGDMGKAMALEKMMKKMPGRGFHTSAYRGGDVSKVFDDVKGVLDEGLVKKVNAVYAFKVEGGESGTWFIDLKNGAGAVGSGDPTSGAADVTFTLKDTDFISMFQGKLKPTNAFMTGKLKLSGDMGKAMALEKMMKKMNSRGYHTMSGKSKL